MWGAEQRDLLITKTMALNKCPVNFKSIRPTAGQSVRLVRWSISRSSGQLVRQLVTSGYSISQSVSQSVSRQVGPSAIDPVAQPSSKLAIKALLGFNFTYVSQAVSQSVSQSVSLSLDRSIGWSVSQSVRRQSVCQLKSGVSWFKSFSLPLSRWSVSRTASQWLVSSIHSNSLCQLVRKPFSN